MSSDLAKTIASISDEQLRERTEIARLKDEVKALKAEVQTLRADLRRIKKPGGLQNDRR